MNLRKIRYGIMVLGLLSACKEKKNTLFSSLPASYTRIDFENRLPANDSLTILDYLYYYNGGGVAIGDVNNDGLPDIYFTSNRGSNKLYLNKGHLQFEDITDKAGVQGKGNWKTGVTLADVNGDGLLDIYVCEVGGYKGLSGRNELFINNGNLTFTERAGEYGLDVEGFNTQASFFDYDGDGDLDMFLVNHSVHSTESYGPASERRIPDNKSGDKLFRNDSRNGTIRFTEVTEQAGIYSSALGYGLNVMTADLNNDGWTDIYVSNDFHENDYYYINNKNGTFSEINQTAFGHESRFSMGSDIADVNNDGWEDIITLDMLSPDEKIVKSSSGEDPLDIYNYKMAQGYHYQYARNCLQLNTGGGRKFREIGLYAGIAATDWSWSPLLTDVNNDGIKDLFISNGIVRRPNDLDYLKFISNSYARHSSQVNRALDSLAISKMPEGKVSNYIFRGTDNLQFADQTNEWGLDKPSFSNGAAYADLDNDGDIDIVVNNINEQAFIYENQSEKIGGGHYINLMLKGVKPNTFAFGARVLIKYKGKLQTSYVTATHGFESASLGALHFGTGDCSVIDTLEVIWPDQRKQILANVKTDQLLTIRQKETTDVPVAILPSMPNPKETLFTDISASIGLPYRHRENAFNDFNVQHLLPHEVSTQGPKLAVADVNGDGLDDFFVCGGAGQGGHLFIQTKRGKFIDSNQPLFAADALCEDVNAIFFDADNDGHPDLYVVSGGNEHTGQTPLLLDRLYLNDGKGNFHKSTGLPAIYENKSTVVAADLDHDGDLDLFIGGRVVAGQYGEIPGSYLLLNDGKGKFSIAGENRAPGLRKTGMVTDAVWSDIDKDGWKDLIIVGEWMPVTVYKNNKGNLKDITAFLHFENTSGLWSTIQATDLDNDGYEELLVGNWGENSRLHASVAYPLKLYTGDMDGNGRIEQIIAVEKGGRYYPFLGKEELEGEVPGIIRKKFLSYRAMAGHTVDEIFGDKLNGMKKKQAHILSSVRIKNDKGHLSVSQLPACVQWAPVFSFCAGDVNGDHTNDIVTGGNFFGVLPYEGRYDAGEVNVLLNHNHQLTEMSPLQSGLQVDGEIRDIKRITIHSEQVYLIARNNAPLVFARLKTNDHFQ